MRILILGFLIFIAWAALSAHIYVCIIKGLCNSPKNMQTNECDVKKANVGNSKTKPLISGKIKIPRNQIVSLK